MCIGHVLRPIIRRQTIPHARGPHAEGHGSVTTSEHPTCMHVGHGRRHSPDTRTRSGHSSRGRGLRALHDPINLPFRASPMPVQVLTDSEQRCADDANLRVHNPAPHTYLLGPDFQAGAREQRRRVGERDLVLD